MLTNLAYHFELLIRLLISCILGGLIGAERETENKNAGFRTHMLVCIASTLVMVTSEYIFDKYAGHTNLDPARLGAQVISGIGFLGAGAIIKEGVNIKGLTTAASLWAVSCVGLAIGAGFYEGAILTTFLILGVLLYLKKFEVVLLRKRVYWTIVVRAKDKPGQIGEIGTILGKYKVNIKDVQINTSENKDQIDIKLTLKGSERSMRFEIINELKGIDGVSGIWEI